MRDPAGGTRRRPAAAGGSAGPPTSAPWSLEDPLRRRLGASRSGRSSSPSRPRSYSTRRLGMPITGVQAAADPDAAQYLGQMSAQQSRFNAQVAAHVMRLEERVARARSEAARETRRASTPR